MTHIPENLRLIRKVLKLTQANFSKTLDIGYRTYVRYEAGERETPASILAKVSQLTKVSLDQLILCPLALKDFNRTFQEKFANRTPKTLALKKSLDNATLAFKASKEENLIKTELMEKELLSLFRKMDSPTRKKCLTDMKCLIKSNIEEDLQSPKKVAKLEKSPQAKIQAGAKR